DEDGRCAAAQDAVRRRDERMADGYDLVPGADADGEESEVEGGGAVRDRTRMRGPDLPRELGFETGDLLALGEPAGENDGARGVGFGGPDQGLRDRDHAGILSGRTACAPAALWPRHQSTRSFRPAASGTVASKPISRCAAETSASRRRTGLTARSGACWGVRSGRPMARDRERASSTRLVSMPVPTFSATSVASDSAARTLA